MIMRACPRAVASANALQLSPDGTTFAPTWQSAIEPVVALERGEAAEPAARDVLEEDALDRLLRAEVEDLFERRADEPYGRDQARL